ncbi:hypothetical protein IV203_015827 [Nitzschia inconspicua]|uniref:Uncharacterized protein n=1 Tax=Nitzschia inconspicua TaxID=303405 RepID=A0A9K3LCY3_9STRA|nr:hypothetical protein IV203_015827 [Nitzschia inconspicua]
MPQQELLLPAASSPPGRRRPSSGTTCPGAPTKKKIPDTSPYRHGDDWLMQYFETNETNCPSSPAMESAWRPQPRRQLFPEDDHERDDQPSFEEQPQPQPRRRLFWDDGPDDEEGQNLPPWQEHHPGQQQLHQQPEQRQRRQTVRLPAIVTPLPGFIKSKRSNGHY